jgi:hypothetical protein
VTERLEQLLEEQNVLLLRILEHLELGSAPKRSVGIDNPGKSRDSLTEEEKQSVEYEIDLEWWFMSYGEDPLPAKYMCSSMGTPVPNSNPYSKDEGTYLFNRLTDFVEEENEAGTHVFKYLGKVWCKRESNARNCFAFVPVKEET